MGRAECPDLVRARVSLANEVAAKLNGATGFNVAVSATDEVLGRGFQGLPSFLYETNFVHLD